MKKVQSSDQRKSIYQQPNYKPLPCSKCGKIVERVGFDSVSVICSWCVQKMIDPPKEYKSSFRADEFKDFPRGWKRKRLYVHEDGRVFERGIENIELKDTLPITKVDLSDKIKLSRREKEELKQNELLEMSNLKKQLKANEFPTRLDLKIL